MSVLAWCGKNDGLVHMKKKEERGLDVVVVDVVVVDVVVVDVVWTWIAAL